MTSELLRRLVRAEECCSSCGTEHGDLRLEDVYWRPGTCPVCSRERPLASTHHFGYLRRGVETLLEL
jgi:hypothetical protein